MKKPHPIVMAIAAAAIAGTAQAAPLAYPSSPKQPVSDSFFGSAVSEDYRWLEKTDSAEVKSWIAAQNALTRGAIDAPGDGLNAAPVVAPQSEAVCAYEEWQAKYAIAETAVA